MQPPPSSPSSSRSTSVKLAGKAPCSVNGIYFATHFGNWYHNAPIADVCAYIRELAKRGSNHLMLWMDISNCYNLDSPDAQDLLHRLRCYAKTAVEAGLRVGLVRVANESWRNSPPELRADPKGGRGAIMLGDVCPSLPAARELIAKTSQQIFGLFEHLDFMCLWPYDSGGCGCQNCQPWGSTGYLVSGEIVAKEFRKKFPKGQVILSTWLMDQNEWGLLRARIERGEVPWIDALMAESIGESTLKDLLAGDVPRGLPLLGFPEISMEGMKPWGGCGANPRPEAIRQRWQAYGASMAGGFPYSEGIYEDVNKAIYAGLYAQPNADVDDILRAYVAREFSPEVVADGVEMLHLMEETHAREDLQVKNLKAAARVWELAMRIQSKLSPAVANHWRWRVLYLRARIDALLAENDGQVTDELRQTFADLHAVYHTDEKSLYGWLLPPLPPQRVSPDPANLAAHKLVTVSSTHPAVPDSAKKLVDEVVAPFDPANYWSSAEGDSAPTIVIDLQEKKPVASVLLQFRAEAERIGGSGGYAVYQFIPSWVSVAVSLDGVLYEEVVTQSRDVPVTGQLYKQWFYEYPVARPGRSLRLTFGPSAATAAPYARCVQLAEIRVH